MKWGARAALVATVALAAVSTGWGYTKPVTYKYDGDEIVFKDLYLDSPHAWMIEKAIELLQRDGYLQEADQARHYLLPMLEGVTFNDVWGDADLAGASVLDYYVPDNAEENYGFGSAFAAYKHSTEDFQAHQFYRFGNAAEYADYHYGFAVRIAHGFWGTDARDRMGGWVVDKVIGQDDPIDERWSLDTAGLDAATGFGDGQHPASALNDLLTYHTRSQVVFPDQDEDTSRRIYIPTHEVFDHAPEWFDDHFGNADDIEAYTGYDGHGFAWYASWTLDAGGAGPNCGGCFLSFFTGGRDTCDAAPMIVRFPVGATAHAFFQLGWAIHLVEDATTPVHTISSSYQTYQVHNDIETRADEVLIDDITWNGHVVKEALPADTYNDFHNLYAWPPIVYSDSSCLDDVRNPVSDFTPRDYVADLERMEGEGVAHAYVRRNAELSHQYYPFIQCINTEDDATWDKVGFFTAYSLDLGIKSVAGLIHQFLADAGLGDHEPPTVTLQTSAVSPTNRNVLSFTGSANDGGSSVASVEISLDDGQTWHAATASDGTFDGVTEAFAFTTGILPDGSYAVRARATDGSGNVTPGVAQPRIEILVDTTPPAITIVEPQAAAYAHSATLVLSYAADDGAGSGVKSVTATMDGSPMLSGHGLASGQSIDLLTELALGSHAFAVTSEDNAGNAATRTVTFAIVVTAESIKGDVTAFTTSGAINQANWASSLLDKLTTAASYRASGDCVDADATYQAFINEVNAQTGKKVSPFAAAIMIGDAQYLIAHCP